jgi:hypothetical protein
MTDTPQLSQCTLARNVLRPGPACRRQALYDDPINAKIRSFKISPHHGLSGIIAQIILRQILSVKGSEAEPHKTKARNEPGLFERWTVKPPYHRCGYL